MLQQNLRLHVYHLLQASARVQDSGIGAKGLTGSGYEGHSFWDIEIYMLPFLIYNLPRVAKNLLIYRYNMLDKAREWAQVMDLRGALFPWRTINGEEASAYFLAGTAQYHINADIAYAIKKYAEITEDNEFLWEYGIEMVIETARLWEDLGFYGKDEKFHYHGVTGPDEYNAIVNDNTFTNLMARENLNYAVQLTERMRKEEEKKYISLSNKINLEDSEIKAWQSAAQKMFIPYNKELGINPQDDAFLDKEKWDLENTPKEKFPLLLHYHPLQLYRFQVIKQADVVLAMFLLGNQFSKELKKKNFEYYDPLTTGDSSLSASIQGIMAAELNSDLSMKYFKYASLMDLGNIGGNVDHGLHLASMGGIWMFIVYGAAGLRDYGGEISFNPKIGDPINGKSKKHLHKLEFQLTIKQCLLHIHLTKEKIIYSLVKGKSISFQHRDEQITLQTGESLAFNE
jgi:alpha,alpha-trehalose phosphorylase